MSAPVLWAWTHELQLMAHPLSVRVARRFVTDVLTEHDLTLLVDDVQLVVSELVTNALLHAETSFSIRLRTSLGPAVVLEVRDGSRASPAIPAMAPLDTTGRGMTIVDALSQAWGVDVHEDGGKSVWAVFPTA